EFGATRRLALKVTVPVVRVATRTFLALSSRGANLGLNPRLQGVPGAEASYADFFRQFDASLAQLGANIANGMYGCPSSPQCQAARDSLAAWTGARDARRGAGRLAVPAARQLGRRPGGGRPHRGDPAAARRQLRDRRVYRRLSLRAR